MGRKVAKARKAKRGRQRANQKVRPQRQRRSQRLTRAQRQKERPKSGVPRQKEKLKSGENCRQKQKLKSGAGRSPARSLAKVPRRALRMRSHLRKVVERSPR